MYRNGAQKILQEPASRAAAPKVSISPAARRTRGLVLFATPQAAEANVAGLPAAARVVREAALAGLTECWLDAGPDWIPSETMRTEVDRLRDSMNVHFPHEVARPPVSGPILLIAGEALPSARALSRGGELSRGSESRGRTGSSVMLADAGDAAAREQLARHRQPGAGTNGYAAKARAIVAATGKPTDGIVSRHINRPISRTVSALLLHVPGFRPSHATAVTALLAVLMFASLLALGQAGLLVGALLFQAASVFDGVDGEAARATFRASHRGAMFDSLVDAATNLAFILGLVINMAMRDHMTAAGFGVSGLVMLAVGLTIIGRRAHASSGPFTFDGVKDRMRARGTRFGQWLIWLTMRDFLALASVVLIVLGLAEPALVAFSIIMAGWLVVVIATGARQSAVLR